MNISLTTTSLRLSNEVDWFDDTLYKQVIAHGYRNIDWSHIPDDWLLYLFLHEEPTLGKKRKMNTLKEYFRDIRHFLSYIHDKDLSVRQTHHEELAHYQHQLSEQGYKPMTLRRKTAVVKSFLSFLYRKGIINEDLTRSMKQIAVEKEDLVNRDFYEEEVQALLDYYKKHNWFMYTMLFVLVSTGLRIQELSTAKWSGVYYHPEVDLYFITVIGKRDKVREVPLFDEVLEALTEFRSRRGFHSALGDDGTALFPKPSGNHYHFKYLSHEFTNQINQLAGVFPFIKRRMDMEEQMMNDGKSIKFKITPHTCRHYTAAYYLSKGADLKAIQNLLDHESSSTTDNYLRRTRKFHEHAAVKIGGQFMKSNH
ncbi:tyrosine-type recombinase/integrase [Pontibacillus yanchengensis]|uniref:Tyrosine-type recombinase/integrase n=1 Tax=Pontibacillus yanchengensis TaxID=462910 RepID=A0A6I5A2T8_9BACI|nr:tyrosine-type recombinase/integrase [Pontibacillus yanchengensis]MYL32871.1 tyrosine-type recombinase/integrase [Pontibacillus yanchengensis]